MLGILWFIITHPLELLQWIVDVCGEVAGFFLKREADRPSSSHMTLVERLERHKKSAVGIRERAGKFRGGF
jgi:hypothetical protein